MCVGLTGEPEVLFHVWSGRAETVFFRILTKEHQHLLLHRCHLDAPRFLLERSCDRKPAGQQRVYDAVFVLHHCLLFGYACIALTYALPETGPSTAVRIRFPACGMRSRTSLAARAIARMALGLGPAAAVAGPVSWGDVRYVRHDPRAARSRARSGPAWRCVTCVAPTDYVGG